MKLKVYLTEFRVRTQYRFTWVGIKLNLVPSLDLEQMLSQVQLHTESKQNTTMTEEVEK
jgi:hypothetical protein